MFLDGGGRTYRDKQLRNGWDLALKKKMSRFIKPQETILNIQMLPMHEYDWLTLSYPTTNKPRNPDGTLKIFWHVFDTVPPWNATAPNDSNQIGIQSWLDWLISSLTQQINQLSPQG